MVEVAMTMAAEAKDMAAVARAADWVVVLAQARRWALTHRWADEWTDVQHAIDSNRPKMAARPCLCPRLRGRTINVVTGHDVKLP